MKIKAKSTLWFALILSFVANAETSTSYEAVTKKIIDSYCAESCHGPGEKVDLSKYSISLNGRTSQQSWQYALRLVEDERMPPPMNPRPTAADIALLEEWENNNFAKTDAEALQKTFDTTPPEPKWLPYVAVFHKVRHLFGDDPLEHKMTRLEKYRSQLGSYNAAQNLQQELNITIPKYQYYIDALVEVCNQEDVQKKFDGKLGYYRFIKRTLGRMPNETELQFFATVAAELPQDQRWALLCYATLSRLEFISQ